MSNDLEDIIRDTPEVDNNNIVRSVDSIKSVLSFRAGRRFIYDLLGVCHFGRSPFSGEAVHTTNALAGKQLVGEWVMDLLTNAYPEAYSLMLKEAKEDNDHDNRKQSQRVANANSTGDTSDSQPA